SGRPTQSPCWVFGIGGRCQRWGPSVVVNLIWHGLASNPIGQPAVLLVDVGACRVDSPAPRYPWDWSTLRFRTPTTAERYTSSCASSSDLRRPGIYPATTATLLDP